VRSSSHLRSSRRRMRASIPSHGGCGGGLR
jgi:hypothetical protein